MGDAEKLRLAADLAASLGNVSEACRRAGVPRHAYYAWKKTQAGADAAHGQRKRHPQALAPSLASEILALAKGNPEWGCDRIAYYLKLKGISVSSPTVQKLLIRNGLGRRCQRMS